jgi:hypothetical protein
MLLVVLQGMTATPSHDYRKAINKAPFNPNRVVPSLHNICFYKHANPPGWEPQISKYETDTGETGCLRDSSKQLQIWI